MYPELKIHINKDFDKEVCYSFLNHKQSGIDFAENIFEQHPELRIISKESVSKQKVFISEYFDSYYRTHEQELLHLQKDNSKQWKSIHTTFFDITAHYFSNHPWPKGNYTAYLSIINCNPRFLDTKVFQVFCDAKEGFIQIAMHEMLHFLFFDLLKQIAPEIDPNSDFAWKISEVFNGLILSEKEYLQLSELETIKQYPELYPLQQKVLAIWQKEKKAKYFIKQMTSSNSTQLSV